MRLAFTKVEGAGNDLVIVDERAQPVADPARLAIEICDRLRGAGGDGILLISRREGLPFVRMFNPDGTEDFCGNGMRCVTAYLWRAGEAGENRVLIQTPRGRHEALIFPESALRFMVEVELVVPDFAPAAIPARLPGPHILRHPLQLAGRTIEISSVSVGTTHTAIFLPHPVDEETFHRFSPIIETHEAFPERTSVLWCHVMNRGQIEMRIWERGAGETFSCGTGTCAAVVIGRALGLTGDRAEVSTRGGRMSAHWDGKGPVRLIGPARIVYTGYWIAGGQD